MDTEQPYCGTEFLVGIPHESTLGTDPDWDHCARRSLQSEMKLHIIIFCLIGSAPHAMNGAQKNGIGERRRDFSFPFALIPI